MQLVLKGSGQEGKGQESGLVWDGRQGKLGTTSPYRPGPQDP